MGSLKDNERRVVLRILDANANRCSEGLRVVEEIARFGLDDRTLLEELKKIRHSVRRGMDALTGGSFRFRDVSGDVGKDFSTDSENLRGSLTGVARANFARAQEALRVIEEFGKLVDASIAEDIKGLRFELYTLEESFFYGGGERLKMPPAPFLYAVLDREFVTGPRIVEVTEEMIEGGVDILQYRAKNVNGFERRSDLLRIITAAWESSVPVIVNDDPELAFETGAGGVHLGEHDVGPGRARALLGPGRIVGITVHSMEELDNAPVDIVDYIAVGSVFPSTTKPEIRPVGAAFLGLVRERLGLPLVAIGGIDPSNADQVLDQGVDGLALISSLLRGDIRKNCFTFRRIIDKRKGKIE